MLYNDKNSLNNYNFINIHEWLFPFKIKGYRDFRRMKWQEVLDNQKFWN